METVETVVVAAAGPESAEVVEPWAVEVNEDESVWFPWTALLSASLHCLACLKSKIYTKDNDTY